MVSRWLPRTPSSNTKRYPIVEPLIQTQMGFPADVIKQVWEKATVVPGNSPDEWRKDQCGAWIGWRYYGNRDSQYGWEVDHITCVANGGTDALSNLRPLQWENNASRQDGRLSCVIVASGKDNVRR